MNEHIERREVKITVGYGPQGTVYRESRAVVGGQQNSYVPKTLPDIEANTQPAECMISGINACRQRLNPDKTNLPELELSSKISEVAKAQIKELHAQSGIIGQLKVNDDGQVSGYGLINEPLGIVTDKFSVGVKSQYSEVTGLNHVAGPFVNVDGEIFVDRTFLEKVKVKDKGVFNFDFQPLEFNDDSALLGYYNDGTGHLYSVAKLVELTKDLVPFDAPIQAIDLSGEIWKNCNVFELAYHVKLVNDADLSYPIILDWNGGIADGRHRLIKALVLGHSTIKCVRMTYKPNFDKVID